MIYSMIKSKGVKFIDFTEEIKRSLLPRMHPKKPRIKLEEWQVARLVQAFEEDTHPSNKAKTNLAQALNLPMKSVQIWFQNRRAKEKSRAEQEQEETENERSPYYRAEGTERPAAPTTPGFQPGFNVFTDHDASAMNMSYDECYHMISNTLDMNESSLLNDDPSSFLGLFSSLPNTEAPGCLSGSLHSPETEPRHRVDLFKESAPSTIRQKMDDTPAQYRLQFRNGSIIYNKDQEKTDFFNEVFNNTSSL